MSEGATQEGSKLARVEIQKIYLKDASWEAPSSPSSFQQPWNPEINVEIKNKANVHEENLYEVIVHISITCRNQKKVAFIIELEQAGLFIIENISEKNRERVIGTLCPSTLFPYARENIDNLAVKGGFAPIQLAPINFEALYQQAVERKQEQESQEGDPDFRVTH